MIYLDNAATTKISDKALEKMISVVKEFYGNSSAIYDYGFQSKKLLEDARGKIAQTLNVNKNEIYFTSGGSESDNWAIVGVAESLQAKGRHIITSKVEHKAVLKTCEYLERRGFEVTYLDVDENGRISLDQLEKAIREDTILISIMYANNEVGTIMPVEEISRIAFKHGIAFHTDAVQAYGHVPIDLGAVPVTMLSASGHKFHGPKGIGFLYIKEGTDISSYIRGGGQENGLRAGTENVPSVVAMAEAAKECHDNLGEEIAKIQELKEYLRQCINNKVSGVAFNGELDNCLPNNINICIQDASSILVVDALSRNDICISTGSACNSSSIIPSHVLTAMGLSEKEAKSSIRISLSRYTTKEEIDIAVERLCEAVEQIREIY